MKNRSHIVTLMAVLAFTCAIIAAISPAALAGRSEVYFSDVSGNPKTEWKVGEVLYITIVSHDENRDSDEVEFIDARSICETHTTVEVPCVEIWDPNTKDSETNGNERLGIPGTLRLVETGIDTGIFRLETGILIRPFEADPGHQHNGTLEVFQGDTIMVRYQSPSDDNDIDLDQAKITTTAGQIRITTQDGRELPVWQVGQQIWVTVEDPDLNTDPLKVESIKNVSLWNPRCVWDVLERAGQPREDQPQPKPCGAPVGFDSRLQAQFPDKFVESLTLMETGPNTGVFRNVNGITLTDNLGPVRQFPAVPTALQLFVNHKETIVAFYRKPTVVGAAAVPPPPPPPVQTRTDSCPASPLFDCSRTVPVTVTPGQTFNVTIQITTRQDMRLIALREQAPAGFRFGTTQANPPPEAISTDGALRAAWNGNIPAGTTITLTYELIAGATPGNFKIRGFVTGAPFTIVPLVSDIVVAGTGGSGLSLLSSQLNDPVSAQVAHTAENAQLRIARDRDTYQANVGGTVTINLTVTAKQALPAVSVKEDFDGLTLADQGAQFIGVDPPSTLRGIMIQPAANTTQTFTYSVRCASQGSFTIRGTAESRNVAPVVATSTVVCGEGPLPPPPPPVGPVTFHRGEAGPNDPQDFALAQAKVGHMNPAKLSFTDINGNELSEFAIGTEFFITLIDDDQNVDSDHVETICVQVFNVNGGREGDTPGVLPPAAADGRVARDIQEMRVCREDHVRDLFMFKTGVQLVETGTNTGIFRNPDALRLIGICGFPETEKVDGPQKGTQLPSPQVQIHQFDWWQGIEAGRTLKDCHPSTQDVDKGRLEFNPDSPTAAVQDEPGVIAVHAGDVVYATFQDQLVDPFDVVYATARVQDFQSIGTVQFVDENGSPVETYKIGQDVFVKLRDDNRNINSNVVDKLEILILDRNSGDWENVILEETGADTGEFMNRQGLSLQPALRPDVVEINNNRLEMFDRDVIEAHYQDNFNSKDYSAAWIRLIPQPLPGPGVPIVDQSTTKFADAQGRTVTQYIIGDSVYVQVTDASRNLSATTRDTIANAVAVKNARTGQSVTVSLTETDVNTGIFLSDAITTGAPGTVGVALEVEDGDTLEAKYTDPANPADTSQATVRIIAGVFSCTGARNTPNPFTVSTTFEALGTGIQQVSVNVYDLSGRLVAQISSSGSRVAWDGRTLTGESLSRGVYLYQVTCSGRLGERETLAPKKAVSLR